MIISQFKSNYNNTTHHPQKHFFKHNLISIKLFVIYSNHSLYCLANTSFVLINFFTDNFKQKTPPKKSSTKIYILIKKTSDNITNILCPYILKHNTFVFNLSLFVRHQQHRHHITSHHVSF